MLTAYIIATIVGGGLILLSALGGFGHAVDFGHDVDFDHGDIGADHDAHIDGGGGLAGLMEWVPFFSLRFWTYFFGIGGLTGLLLTLFSKMPEPGPIIASVCVGALLGTIATFTLKWLFRTQQGASMSSLLGAHGKMLVGIREGQVGKVRVERDGMDIDIIALSASGIEIGTGEKVFVVGFEGEKALIMRQDEVLEQTTSEELSQQINQ